MPRMRSRCVCLLAAAALATAMSWRTFNILGFVVGRKMFRAGLKPGTQTLHSVALKAAGRVALADADAVKAVASALNGKKLSGKPLTVTAEDKDVVFDGLDGDWFGNADIQGNLFGTTQGKAVVFDTRNTNDTPKAVAWVASNSIRGMFVVGTGGAKPSSQEISWASSVSSAMLSLDIEGPISSFGLPKRWNRALLKAAAPPEKPAFTFDTATTPVYAVGVFALGLIFLLSGNTYSPSDGVV
mmetsp:Transcript_13451/g.26402  ORF Transcript_13451/g.26402 Transcript_13451/m.26402 type:complete len:242 (+) Transcript_13451:47-772(+)